MHEIFFSIKQPGISSKKFRQNMGLRNFLMPQQFPSSIFKRSGGGVVDNMLDYQSRDPISLGGGVVDNTLDYKSRDPTSPFFRMRL